MPISNSFAKRRALPLRLASRLTNGANSNDLDEGEQRQASDLDFSFNINDLSLPARQYIQKSRLNTHEDGRKDASEILNLVLEKATQALFNQLFNFRGRAARSVHPNP
jgi:hypothetical protein